ncbi:MAG: alpha/beta hydrolase, partial [Acidimicrobiia bacterium]|nr:alpha/beta hydrolase [Acidimicrobiia bacterium]
MDRFTIDLAGPVYGIDHGGQGRPVVLVHGLGGSHHNWNALVPHIAHLGHVYALDLSGFGRTPPARRGSSVDANQQLVNDFIGHLDDGPVVLVGNSMGGMISLMQAAR